MAFTAKSGTRGGRRPGGVFMRLFNRHTAKRIRGGSAGSMGLDSLLLITVGSKTGQRRETPVGRFAAPGGGWYIVASANGARQNPSWYHNLAAHPNDVRIVVEGRETAVHAEQLAGEERARVWQDVCAEQPRFAKYAAKTDREIPIIRLNPVASGT